MCVNEIQDNDRVRIKDGIHVCERDTRQRQG